MRPGYGAETRRLQQAEGGLFCARGAAQRRGKKVLLAARTTVGFAFFEVTFGSSRPREGDPCEHHPPCPAVARIPDRCCGRAVACRKPQIVRARLSSPVFAFATMPWKYPPGVDRKCSAGFAETIAIAIAACSRPMARQASPQRDFETPSSPRSQSAASTISGQAGVGVFR